MTDFNISANLNNSFLNCFKAKPWFCYQFNHEFGFWSRSGMGKLFCGRAK
jgi:hypothetical protein